MIEKGQAPLALSCTKTQTRRTAFVCALRAGRSRPLNSSVSACCTHTLLARRTENTQAGRRHDKSRKPGWMDGWMRAGAPPHHTQPSDTANSRPPARTAAMHGRLTEHAMRKKPWQGKGIPNEGRPLFSSLRAAAKGGRMMLLCLLGPPRHCFLLPMDNRSIDWAYASAPHSFAF